MMSQLDWEELRLRRARIKTILLFKIVNNLVDIQMYHQNRSSFQLAPSLEDITPGSFNHTPEQ